LELFDLFQKMRKGSDSTHTCISTIYVQDGPSHQHRDHEPKQDNFLKGATIWWFRLFLKKNSTTQ